MTIVIILYKNSSYNFFKVRFALFCFLNFKYLEKNKTKTKTKNQQQQKQIKKKKKTATKTPSHNYTHTPTYTLPSYKTICQNTTLYISRG